MNQKIKNIVIVVHGAPEGQDILQAQIEPGTTCRDILNHFGLVGFTLLPHGTTTHLAAAEVLWPRVEDGAKLIATPIAEVG